MARERLSNRALLAPDEDAFLATQLEGLLAYPTYYREMAPLNRTGPPLLGVVPAPLPPLPADEVAARIASGAWLVDARSRREFAAAHVPGSINVELDESFASYVGWVVPFGAELVLVLPGPEGEAAGEAAVQLHRIGYDRVAGFLAGGVPAWEGSGRPTASYATVDLEELCREWRDGRAGPILDVRQRSEWDAGHIDGSRFLFVGDLPGRTGEVGGGEPVSVICRSGHRAAIAASLLDRDGIPVRLVPSYGVPRFLTRCTQRGM
jgi:rhodanese-related sulfurtransferase